MKKLNLTLFALFSLSQIINAQTVPNYVSTTGLIG